MPNDMIVSRRMAQVEIIKTVNAVREAYGLPNPIIADALRAVLMDLTQEELLSIAVALAQPEKPEEAEKQEETPSGEHDSVFPARAGVILQDDWIDDRYKGLSRASGGDPGFAERIPKLEASFPRERG